MADAPGRVRYSVKAHLRARPLPVVRRVLRRVKTLPQKPSSASHLRRSGCLLQPGRSSRPPYRRAVLRLRLRVPPRPRPILTQIPISPRSAVVRRALRPSPRERSPRPQRPWRQLLRLRPPTSPISPRPWRAAQPRRSTSISLRCRALAAPSPPRRKRATSIFLRCAIPREWGAPSRHRRPMPNGICQPSGAPVCPRALRRRLPHNSSSICRTLPRIFPRRRAGSIRARTRPGCLSLQRACLSLQRACLSLQRACLSLQRACPHSREAVFRCRRPACPHLRPPFRQHTRRAVSDSESWISSLPARACRVARRSGSAKSTSRRQPHARRPPLRAQPRSILSRRMCSARRRSRRRFRAVQRSRPSPPARMP